MLLQLRMFEEKENFRKFQPRNYWKKVYKLAGKNFSYSSVCRLCSLTLPMFTM